MATALKQVEYNVGSLISLHRGQIRRREWSQLLGRLEQVLIEPSGVSRLADNPLTLTKKQTAALDWYGQGPLTALSHQGELLVCDAMLKPPRIPDPGWLPPADWAVTQPGQPMPKPPKAPTIEQRLRDRAAGVVEIEKKEWLVFQPIHQVLLLSYGGKGFTTVNCRPDLSGRHTILLYQPRTKEAFFLFGRLTVDSYE